MSWFNSGVWDGVYIERAATLIHQLAYTINELERACGRGDSNYEGPWKKAADDYGGGAPNPEPYTKWYVADGSQMYFPATSDFLGMKVEDPNFQTNLMRMRTAIETLLPETQDAHDARDADFKLWSGFSSGFLTTENGTTRLYYETAQANTDYGFGWAGPGNSMSAAVALMVQIRQILDQMKYIVYAFHFGQAAAYSATKHPAKVRHFERAEDAPIYDFEDAWDSAKGDSETETRQDYDRSKGFIWIPVGWECIFLPPNVPYYARLSREMFDLETSFCRGTCTGHLYRILTEEWNLIGSVSFTLGSTTWTIDSGDGSDTTEHSGSGPDFMFYTTSTNNVLFEVTSSEPANAPFLFDPEHGGVAYSSFSPLTPLALYGKMTQLTYVDVS